MNVTDSDARGSGFFCCWSDPTFQVFNTYGSTDFSLKNALICSEVLVPFQKEKKGKPIDSTVLLEKCKILFEQIAKPFYILNVLFCTPGLLVLSWLNLYI